MDREKRMKRVIDQINGREKKEKMIVKIVAIAVVLYFLITMLA